MTTYASDDWVVYEQKFTHHDQPPKGPGWEPFAVVGNGPTRILYWRRQKPARKAEPEYRFSPDFLHGAVDRQHLTVARYSGEVRHNGDLIGILHTDRTDEELWAEAKKLLRVQLSTQVVSLGRKGNAILISRKVQKLGLVVGSYRQSFGYSVYWSTKPKDFTRGVVCAHCLRQAFHNPDDHWIGPALRERSDYASEET